MTAGMAKSMALRTCAAMTASLLLAACQPGMKPVAPAGDAGYAAIAVDPASGAPARYELAAGDQIAVRVYQEPELSVEELTVDNAGMISLPLIGDIPAAGRSPSALARSIEEAYGARYVRDPRVSVQIRRGRVQTVAVEGEVEQPGVYPYEPGQTLLTAMALARSPTEVAKLDEVMIFRQVGGERLAGRFDLAAIRGGRLPDVVLQPGDTIVVGYNSLRGGFLDAVRAVPSFGIFRPY